MKKRLNEASEAAELAHKLGLESAGFGRWKDPETGVIVAKTIGKYLVRIDPKKDLSDDEYFAHGKIKGYLPSEWEGKERHKVDKRLDTYFPTDYNSTETDYSRQKFEELLEKKLPPQGVVNHLKEMLKVNPDVQTGLYSYKADQYRSMYAGNLGTSAFYDSRSKQIHVGTVASRQLASLKNVELGAIHMVLDSVNNDVSLGQDTPESPLLNKIADAVRGVHVIIHEMVHAKDRYLEKPENLQTSQDEVDTVFIFEGLTEYKARQITMSLISEENREYFPETIARLNGNSYRREVACMQMLDDIEANTTSKLWELNTVNERRALIKKTVTLELARLLKDKAIASEDEVEIPGEILTKILEANTFHLIKTGKMEKILKLCMNNAIPLKRLYMFISKEVEQ